MKFDVEEKDGKYLLTTSDEAVMDKGDLRELRKKFTAEIDQMLKQMNNLNIGLNFNFARVRKINKILGEPEFKGLENFIPKTHEAQPVEKPETKFEPQEEKK